MAKQAVEIEILISSNKINVEIAEQLRRYVLDVCKEGGIGDPLSADKKVRETGREWYTRITTHLIIKGWVLPARNLLLELWDLYAERQRSCKRRVYRALLSQLLTQMTYQMGKIGEALRWSLLTQADDILGEHSQEGGYGRHWLYGIFGLSNKEKESFDDIGKECLKETKKKDWDCPSGFAEEVLRRFAQKDHYGPAVLQRLASLDEAHLTRPYLRVLLDCMNQATDNISKGRRLEDIASYLFSLVPGCIPRRNVLDKAIASEYDLVVSNIAPTSSLTEALFGRDFLIECKNWQKSIGAQEVGYFLFRMGLTQCRFGVILSKNGITKSETGEMYAEALIRRAYHQHSSVCVVITKKDLEELVDGQIHGITDLLIHRLNEWRFGEQK